MKRLTAVLCVPLLLLAAGCSKDKSVGGSGTLNIRLGLDEQTTLVPTQAFQTKAGPDLSTFTLEVLQSGNRVQKLPSIGSNTSPRLTLPAGDYTVAVYSQLFTAPAFDTPVYGASHDLVIMPGDNKNISMVCSQTNAGVTIAYSETFKQRYATYSARIEHPKGTLVFKDNDALRTGYFPEGYANLIITADGQEFKQSILLKARWLHSITVKDAEVPVTSGNANITITITTDVENESLDITFPADGGGGSGGGTTAQTLYTENLGVADVTSPTMVLSYAYWQNQSGSGIAYDGSGKVDCQPGMSSNYTGASGGNYLTLVMGNKFDITGLNTTGYQSLSFSFGGSSATASFNPSDIAFWVNDATAPADGTLLSYTRSSAPGWQTAQITSGIPESSNLRIRIICNNGTYRLDDFKLTGTK